MVKLKNGFTGERALVLPRMIVDKLEEDPLTSMLHITDIGYYPKAKHHFRERKEPIELGVNTAHPCSRATSNTFHSPSMPIFQASFGFDSATTSIW